mmetsp:Transcript_42205/g.122067  ORF Transcript_42205/g.122067 Transcript_42205/m.122067 type:complete len:349 (+) Transcript_42205:478-1524(+)
MSLFTTRGTSSGSFIRKVILRTRVSSTRLLLAQGTSETSVPFRCSRTNRRRQSSFSNDLTTTFFDRSSCFSTFVGASFGASAEGVPLGVSANMLERFSDHMRVTIFCVVLRLFFSPRIDFVLSTRGAFSSKFAGLAEGGGASLFIPDGLMSLASIVGGGMRTPSSVSGMFHSSSLPPVSGTALPWRRFQNSKSHSTSACMLSCSFSTENFRPPPTEAVTKPLGFPAAGRTLLKLEMSRQGTNPVSKVIDSPAIGPLSNAIPKSLMKRQPTIHSSSPKEPMHICLRKRKPPSGYTASQSACSCGSGRSHCLALGIFTSRIMFSSSIMFLRTSAITDAAPAGKSNLATSR